MAHQSRAGDLVELFPMLPVCLLRYLCFTPSRSSRLIPVLDNWMNNKVLVKTAPAPEGPWSAAITLYQATPITKGSSIYAAAPHPYYDLTGKTLVVTFTNHPNVIQAVRVVSQTGLRRPWPLVLTTEVGVTAVPLSCTHPSISSSLRSQFPQLVFGRCNE